MTIPDSVKLLLRAEKAELESKITPLQQRLDQINNVLGVEEEKIGNWNEKILTCLKHVNKPLTTVEILNYIFYNRESQIKDKDVRRRYIKQLSLTLHRLCNKGELLSDKIS